MAKEITNHGQAGYRRGCRCETCRAGHRVAAAEYRARKRKPAVEAEPLAPLVDVPAPDVLAPAGPIESALAVELDELIGEPPWRGTLSAMLKANARVLDQVHVHERFDIMSGLQTRMLDMLDRLRRVESGGSGVPEGWAAALSDADD